jgi:hypothetical protein
MFPPPPHRRLNSCTSCSTFLNSASFCLVAAFPLVSPPPLLRPLRDCRSSPTIRHQMTLTLTRTATASSRQLPSTPQAPLAAASRVRITNRRNLEHFADLLVRLGHHLPPLRLKILRPAHEHSDDLLSFSRGGGGVVVWVRVLLLLAVRLSC